MWAEKIIKELSKTNKQPQKETVAADTIPFKTNKIKHSDTTELGPILPVMKAWETLDFPSILTSLGFNPSQIRDSALSIMNRLIDPCSENSLPEWIKTTSFEDLFGKPVRGGKKDRFYRIADLLYKNKEKIEMALREKEVSLFNLEEVIILYDLTNTYFEGESQRNPKAKRGNSKEKRFDAPLLSVGLVLDSEGFVIRHDVFDGNSHDSQSLIPMVQKLQERQKKTEKPLIILDSGFSSEENLNQLQKEGFDYIVVGKRPIRLAYEKEFSTLPFKEVEGRPGRPSVKIATKEEGHEKIILCQSEGRKKKEEGILSKAEDRYLKDLEKLKIRLQKGQLKKVDVIHKALGRLLERHPRVARYYDVTFDQKKWSLSWKRQDEKYESAFKANGNYCLRTNRKDLDDQKIWHLYISLTRVESGFKTLKSHLGLRPVFHQREDRCDSHIFITILAYRLLHWIEYSLRKHNEVRSWKSIRRVLKTHAYTTISLFSDEGKALHLRVPGTPEWEQKRIYKLLGINYTTLPRRQMSFI
ncbi:MAG: IS1634 family transposase [Candidatus Omnitrophica bacterium]|nr:IS1634 family transposase [Candidatus Omnitrophota bacterium]